MKRVHNLSAVAAVVLSGVVLASCGGSTGSRSPTAGASDATGFSAIAKQAHGQTVRWWLYGGDDKVNAYVDDVVAPAARKLGVRIRRVPVTDTADALQRGRRTSCGQDLRGRGRPDLDQRRELLDRQAGRRG